MDNRTIRRAVMRRCPEVYFISPPRRGFDKTGKKKIFFLMLAKIEGIKIPVELHCDMPETALISHWELLSTMVNEIYDEISALKTGKKNLEMLPDTAPPLSAEGQRVFDNPEIQYYVPGTANVDPKASKIILP
jgi:hypothetical protein